MRVAFRIGAVTSDQPRQPLHISRRFTSQRTHRPSYIPQEIPEPPAQPSESGTRESEERRQPPRKTSSRIRGFRRARGTCFAENVFATSIPTALELLFGCD
jgi:hypothetical protein